MKKRLKYMDMFRGISVITMVFYHLLSPSVLKTVTNHLSSPLLLSFFVISGFFFTPGKRSVSEAIRLRSAALLKPFFQYSLLFWLIGSVYLTASGGVTILEALGCLRNFYAGCIWNRVIQDLFHWPYYSLGSRYPFLAPFWFLPAMMLGSILFFPIAEKVLPSVKKTAAAILALFAVTGALRYCSISLAYNFQLAPFWCACMLSGALAASVKAFDLPGFSDGKKWLVFLFFLALGSALTARFEPVVNLFRGTFVQGREVQSMLEVISSSFCFIFGLACVLKLLEEKGYEGKALVFCGVESMDIFIFHMFFAWVLSILTGIPLKAAESGTAAFLRSLFLVFGSFALCIGVPFLRKKLRNQQAAPEEGQKTAADTKKE